VTHTRRSPIAGGLGRTITATELAGLILLEILLWISYRRQRLRWRTQNAVARWENDLIYGRRRQTKKRR
jgi:hypothetical protein